MAVIGAGLASPAGFAWRGLVDALAATQPAPSRGLAATHPTVVGYEVPAIPDAIDVGDRKLHRLMSRGARLGAVAMRAALDDAGVVGERREAAGCFFGVGASNSAPDELDAVLRAATDDAGAWSERKMCEKGLKVFHPLRTFALMPNMTLCHAAIALGTRGPSAAMFSRGSGTVASLIEAAWAIADGTCEVAIAGGADTAHDCLTWSELRRERARVDLVPGEGGAALVLGADGPEARAWITGAVVRRDVVPRALLGELGESRIVVLAGVPADQVVGIDATVIDANQLGEALAASAALGWCIALDAIATHEASSVTVLSAGPDDHVAAVRFVARDPRAVEPLPFEGSGEVQLVARDGSRRRIRRDSMATPVPQPRRAVIVGVGAVSAFGVGQRALLDGLAAGKRAIRPLTCFDASALGARIGGQVPVDRIDAAWLQARLSPAEFARVESWVTRGALRDRKVAFAIVAAAEAWRSAGLGARDGVPLALACGLEHAMIGDLTRARREGRIDWDIEGALDVAHVERTLRRAGGKIRNRAAVDLASRAVGDLLGLGPLVTHVSACAAGALSIAHAAAMIERGESIVVCGATDSMLDPIGVGGMVTLGTTSPRGDDLDACRPFDRRRDGLVLGEGAALFVVEEEQHALARGARPLARVLGWGASQDAYKPSAPEPEGAVSAIAMRRALERAGLQPHELGYINAHGTGTPLNDVAEVRAIRRALGEAAAAIPVSSIKGAVGHLMAASGSIEVAASLLAFERDLLPGTANHRERDPECDLDIVGEAPRVATVDSVMSSSFGFGGQNAAVVLGRCS